MITRCGRLAPSGTPRQQRGVTLVELMVALAIGLVIVIALSAVFVGSSNARREVDTSADAIESGRYALDLMKRELSQTGFYGSLIVPAGIDDKLCSVNIAEWRDSLALHAVGLDSAAADPLCLTDRKAGTDAVFIQRASTCFVGVVGPTGCAADPTPVNSAYIQVSECGDEYSATPAVVDLGNATTFTLQTKACTAGTVTERRKLIRRIYYISNANVLSYIELTLAGASAPVALVDNVEQMQFSYAFDKEGDGTAECYGATPADCANPPWAPTWDQVIGTRIWLLARSATATRSATPAQQFDLDDTTVNVAAATTNLKRRVNTAYIPFVTPKSRREQ